jgi:hypothetical protein
MNHPLSPARHLHWLILVCLAPSVFANDLNVRLIPINDGKSTAQAYAAGWVNAVAFRIHSIVTHGDQQFASFYEPADDPKAVGHQGKVIIARRNLNSAIWEIFRTPFEANKIDDAHDAISIGIDGSGFMHLGWGMHTDAFHYAKTLEPATGSGPIEFGPDQSMTGKEKTRITYPEFYNLPNGDLLYVARRGVSGNGDMLINRYSIADKKWSHVLDTMIQGQYPGMRPANAYWDNLAVDSKGGFVCTWVWRSKEVPGGEKGYQTNHDLLYARSGDEGKTWNRFDGTPYQLPITQKSADVVVQIPEGGCLTNMSSLAIDQDDHPLIGNSYAPRAQEQNWTRQYMLAYYDGRAWQTSQITQRTAVEPKYPEQFVGDLARPVVLVDKAGRVLMVIRYKEGNNRVMVAWSRDRRSWEFLTLDSADMGRWEPTYDPVLWQRENKLDLYYEPCSLGKPASDACVLEWDERAYFAGRDRLDH